MQMGRGLVLLLLVAAAALPGCGKQQAAPAPAAGAAAGGAAAQPEAVVKLGEAVDLGGLRVAALQVQRVESKLAPNQRVGLAVRAQVQNAGKQPVSVSSITWFTLEDPEGRTYRVASQIHLPEGERLDGYLDVGQQRQGWFGFDVTPRDGDWTLTVRLGEGGRLVKYRFPLPR